VSILPLAAPGITGIAFRSFEAKGPNGCYIDKILLLLLFGI